MANLIHAPTILEGSNVDKTTSPLPGLNQILPEIKTENLCLHLKSFQSGRSSCFSMSTADSVEAFSQDPAFKNEVEISSHT